MVVAIELEVVTEEILAWGTIEFETHIEPDQQIERGIGHQSDHDRGEQNSAEASPERQPQNDERENREDAKHHTSDDTPHLPGTPRLARCSRR